MEPETRDKRLLWRIEWMIFAAALAGGIGAALYYRDWLTIGLVGCVVFVALAIIYTVLALLFVWPRLRWRNFLAEVVEFLAF
jgi:hypothetical protein